jgi:hypothetical protein
LFERVSINSQKSVVEVIIMSNELFVELNDEQQEIVTGGAEILSLSATGFKQEFVYAHTGASSGPQGSVAGSYGTAQKTETFGFGLLEAHA